MTQFKDIYIKKVSRASFPGQWGLSVDSGAIALKVISDIRAVCFITDEGVLYALNGMAKELGILNCKDLIWHENISSFLNRSRCNEKLKVGLLSDEDIEDGEPAPAYPDLDDMINLGLSLDKKEITE